MNCAKLTRAVPQRMCTAQIGMLGIGQVTPMKIQKKATLSPCPSRGEESDTLKQNLATYRRCAREHSFDGLRGRVHGMSGLNTCVRPLDFSDENDFCWFVRPEPVKSTSERSENPTAQRNDFFEQICSWLATSTGLQNAIATMGEEMEK